MRIRLARQGEVGPGGGPAGDLYVEIHERPHDVFTRKGDDLHCRVTLPMTAAALGTALTLETLDGEEELDIRAGHPAGQTCITAARPGRAAPARHRPRRPARPPRRADADQARRRAGGAAARAGRAARRGARRGHLSPTPAGLFSRLRDAFNGR